MSHKEQYEFLVLALQRHSDIYTSAQNILEIGSQIIWESRSTRNLFPPTKNFLGVDLGKARGVDLVVPGELFQLPDGWADISISAECFEHANNWEAILMNMIRITGENGLVLVTCAGYGRATHGTIDTDTDSSPYTTSYYRNLAPVDIGNTLDLDRYFSSYGFEVNCMACDTYFWGVRNGTKGAEILDSEEALARTRGQVGMLVVELANLKQELKIKNQLWFQRYMYKLWLSLKQVKAKLRHMIFGEQ